MRKTKTFQAIFFLVLSALIFSGCSMVKTINTINGGSNSPLKGNHSVDFEMVENTMFVKVRINGSEKEYDFIFDTGAINAIDDDLAEELGLKEVSSVKATDSGNKTTETKVYKANKLSIENSLVYNDAGFVALDLDFVEEILGRKVDGIIGNNFLKDLVVTIYYSDSTLTFSQHYKLEKISDRSIVMPFDQNLSSGLSPMVKCSFGGYEINGYLDCGNSGYITFPIAELEKSNILSFPHIVSHGSSGGGAFGLADSSQNYLIQIDNFNIGTFSGSGILLNSSSGTTCLIGNEFLSEFIVSIDYPEKQLMLTPIDEKPEFETNPFEKGFAALKTDNGRYKVILITENSPAEKSGLKLGDEITEINGKKSEEISNSEFRELVSGHEKIEIVFLHENNLQKVSLSNEYLFKN